VSLLLLLFNPALRRKNMPLLWLHSRSVSGVRLGCRGRAQASFLSARGTGVGGPQKVGRDSNPLSPGTVGRA